MMTCVLKKRRSNNGQNICKMCSMEVSEMRCPCQRFCRLLWENVINRVDRIVEWMARLIVAMCWWTCGWVRWVCQIRVARRMRWGWMCSTWLMALHFNVLCSYIPSRGKRAKALVVCHVFFTKNWGIAKAMTLGTLQLWRRGEAI